MRNVSMQNFLSYTTKNNTTNQSFGASISQQQYSYVVCIYLKSEFF